MAAAFEVIFVNGTGWIVEENGIKWENKRGNAKVYHIKADALEAARKAANRRKPSVLRVYGRDGELQREQHYN